MSACVGVMSVPPCFYHVLCVSLALLCCVYECGVVCRRVLSHLHCVRGAFGVMFVMICVHVGLRRPAGSKSSSLFVLSVLCCVYECGEPCRCVPFHLHCVRGAFGVLYVVLRVHVVLRRPAESKCSSLFVSCLVCVCVFVVLCV